MTPPIPSLVVITDRHAVRRSNRTVTSTVAAALDAGAPAVLLRDKDLPADERRSLGDQLRLLTTAAGAQLLVASDAVLARHLGADGLHLAAADPPCSEPLALLGRSCHDRAEVAAARDEGATYAFVSPVAASRSKPGHGPALGPAGLKALLSVAEGLPLLALGGVDATNATAWRSAGAHGLAVMGHVMGAPDPAAAVRGLLAASEEAAGRATSPFARSRRELP